MSLSNNWPSSLDNRQFAGKWILFGEDDMDDKEIIEEAFKEIDPSIHICFVTSGKEIVQYLQNCREEEAPSLIVLDYNMPALTGAEILKKLQPVKHLKHVPKLIWSTSGASLYKNICMELGVQGYLVKPSSIEQLEDMVRYMLTFLT